MKTAIDYIENAIEKYLAYSVEGSHKAQRFTITDLLKVVEKAKKLQRQQHAQTWDAAIDNACKTFVLQASGNNTKPIVDFDDYFKSKYETTEKLE